METPTRDKTALIWEGDGGEVRRYTYAEMNAQVCRLANAMREMGMRPGDSAGIFMPMIPETVFAMFACLKIGVIAIPIFSGFGPEAVTERLDHAEARLVFTSNGGMRRGKEVGVKALMDQALEAGTQVEKVVVFQRTETSVPMQAGRDVYWDDFVRGQPDTKPKQSVCPPRPSPSSSTPRALPESRKARCTPTRGACSMCPRRFATAWTCAIRTSCSG